MTISKTIADFTDALEAARAELAEVNSAIERLENERRRVAAAPPHTDAIVALYMRGLEAASAEFEGQFARHLKDTFLGPESAAAVAKGRSASLLRLEARKLDREELMSRSMRGEKPEFSDAALTYFLRDQIAAEISALIDKLFPAGREGVRDEDRQRTLDELDAELATLFGKREALVADLGAARRAVIK